MHFLQLIVDGVIVGAVVALAALGLTLIFGIQRFVNVAHGDFLTVGAYVTYSVVGFLAAESLATVSLAALSGVVATTVIGLAAYYLVFRPLRAHPPVTMVVASIGLGLVLRYGTGLIWGTRAQTLGLPARRAIELFGIRVTPFDIGVLAVALLAMLAFYLLMRLTRLGLEMRAVADLPALAKVSGINSGVVAKWTWGIAAILAAVAGIGMAATGVLTPFLGWNILLPAFSAAVLGGIGSPHGAVVGGFIMGIAQETSTTILPESYKPAVAFVAIIVVLLFRPHGIFGVSGRA